MNLELKGSKLVTGTEAKLHGQGLQLVYDTRRERRVRKKKPPSK